jgi:hypothetical protein
MSLLSLSAVDVTLGWLPVADVGAPSDRRDGTACETNHGLTSGDECQSPLGEVLHGFNDAAVAVAFIGREAAASEGRW